MKKICIIGAGSWGTALALTAHRAGQRVTLLPRRREQSDNLNQQRVNHAYLPGVSLPSDLAVSRDLACLEDADIVLQVTPAQTIGETCMTVKKYLLPHVPWVICAKGIVRETGEKDPQLLSKVSQEILSNPIAVLSGPSFADEVGLNLPTAVTVASQDMAIAKLVASSLRHKRFRCYVSDDPLGVQVAGAVKNILAIACGIIRSKGFGNNAAAALITRGLAEIHRLGLALGGKSATFFGLAGIGDVTLTCSSEQSRNMRLGVSLGKAGANVAQVLETFPFLPEGVPTVAAVLKLSQSLSVSMPLCSAVYEILYHHTPVDDVIEKILSRQSEVESLCSIG